MVGTSLKIKEEYVEDSNSEQPPSEVKEQNFQQPSLQNEEQTGWTFDDVVAALHYVACPLPLSFSGFSIDSRTIKPGEVFIALKGEHFDGHDFIDAAYKNGASLCLVEKEDLPILNDKNYLIVEDTKKALVDLASFARDRTKSTIIAVSGSVGKTTTRTWISRILSNFGPTVSTSLNQNGQIGLPLSMLALKQGSSCTQSDPLKLDLEGNLEPEFGVFEIGISCPNTMRPLAELCRPHVVVMQNLTKAHTQFFKSMDELAAEKAQLIRGLEPNGILVLTEETYDNYPVFTSVALDQGIKKRNIVKVGTTPAADAFIKTTFADFDTQKTVVEAELAGIPVSYTLPAIGDHFVLDSLVALVASVVSMFDTDFASIMKEHWDEILPFLPFQKLTPLSGRGEVLSINLPSGGELTLFDSSYNANPKSMQKEIEAFCSYPSKGRKILVLGDMLELGTYATQEHEKLFEGIEKGPIDKVFAVGSLTGLCFKTLSPSKQGFWADKTEDLIEPLCQFVKDKDAVLFKGSHAFNLNKLVQFFLNLSRDLDR